MIQFVIVMVFVMSFFMAVVAVMAIGIRRDTMDSDAELIWKDANLPKDSYRDKH